MSRAVVCIARTEEQTERIIDRLKDVGIQNSDIAVFLPERSEVFDAGIEQYAQTPEGASFGVSAGGVTGGVLGWLAGIGMLTIPAAGPLFAAGPIVAALSGAAMGATLGGIAGGLIEMGILEYQAKQYETKIQAGNILISVTVYNNEEAYLVEDVFEMAQGEDILAARQSNRTRFRARHEYHSQLS